MSMTACKECGHQVSEKAEACPNCGRQRPGGGVSSTVVLSTVIVGIVLLLIFGALMVNTMNNLSR